MLGTVESLARLVADSRACQAALRSAEAVGAEILLVGGAVRDSFLKGTLSDDLDFLVLNVAAEQVAQHLASSQQGCYILLDEGFGIHRVVLFKEDEALGRIAEVSVDLADARNNDLVSDLSRRDITFNALAYSLTTGRLYDLFDGLRDLETQQIRMVSRENLLDDPLRMLRVFRMMSKLPNGTGYVDSETLACIRENGKKLLESAPERIHAEFFKLLSAEPAYPALQALADSGLLEIILPELAGCRTVPANTHHHLPLFEHTLEVARQCEVWLPQLPEFAQRMIRAPFNPTVSLAGLVKLAALLHDVGKPQTMVVVNAEKTTFHGHDAVSEEMTEEIFRRWRAGREPEQLVRKLVRWHLYPCQFGPESSRKAVLRFFRRMGADAPALILLALADRFSTCGPAISAEDLGNARRNHLWLLDQFETEQAVLSQPRLVTGNDLLTSLSLSPGPVIGKLLAGIEEAQQLGELRSKEEALAWAAQTLQREPL
jgi:tRNA nucleotidyltransferase/poly(A) polymerase